MGNPGLIDEAFVNTFIKKRDKELHKGDCGKVLIIAGSEGMAGAAVLSARGPCEAEPAWYGSLYRNTFFPSCRSAYLKPPVYPDRFHRNGLKGIKP